LRYIKPEERNRYVKYYSLTSRGMEALVHDDNPTRNQEAKTPFTLHSSKFSFPIVSGMQPRSKHPVKMKNWTGYDFSYPLYSIRTTPRAVHVFVNVELSGESVEELNKKYEALAIGYAGKFAESHDLKVGSPKPYQDPHFTLKNNALAKIVSEVGNVKTPDIHIDRSRSSGDLEMGYETAKGMEFTISQMPAIVASFRVDMETMKETIKFFVESLQALIPQKGQEQKQEHQPEPEGYA
jgi:uncharacterized coiled-coil protein SlyX